MNDDFKEAEKAYHYLASTDEEYTNAKALMVGRKHMLKVAYSVAYLESGESTVAAREASANCSEALLSAISGYREAVLEYETLDAKRQRALLAIERWRTLEATRRKTT